MVDGLIIYLSPLRKIVDSEKSEGFIRNPFVFLDLLQGDSVGRYSRYRHDSYHQEFHLLNKEFRIPIKSMISTIIFCLGFKQKVIY